MRADAPTRSPRLALVVNAPGIQERRALALEPHLSRRFDPVIRIRPTVREAIDLARSSDLLYVIDPGAGGFPAAVAGRTLGRTVVVEVGDPQRELYAAQGRSRGAQWLGGGLDRAVASHASGIVVRGAALAGTLDVTVPHIVAPDGVELDRFAFNPRGDEVRRSLGIEPGALVVGVAGSLHWSTGLRFTYGLDAVEAAARLPEGQVHVLVVGDGDGLEHLRRRAAQLGYAHLHTPGRVAHDAVPDYLSAMDVCLSSQSRDAIGRARTTAKLPEYLAADRHVLATDVGTAATILPDEMLMPTDISRLDEHVEALKERLAALAGRQSELRGGVGTRSIAAEHFAYDVIAARVSDFLRDRLEADSHR